MAGSRVVFIDIDATLVDHRGTVPRSAVEAIRCARQRGHRVLLATGRSLRDIWSEVLEVGFDGVVASSGAHVTMRGEVLACRAMCAEQVDHATRMVRARGGEYFLHTPEVTYATRGAAEIVADVMADRVARGASREVLKRGAFAFLDTAHRVPAVLPEEVTKITYLGAHLTDDEVVGVTLDCVTPAKGAAGNGGTSGEILAPGVSKAFGLRAVLDRLGAARSDSVAIGDGCNDISMLAAAGTGVAMSNAAPCVRQAADLVVNTPCRDGVAQAFDALGLLGARGLRLPVNA